MRERIPFKSELDKGDVNLLTWVKFVEEVKGHELFYVLIGKELIGGVPILKFLKSLIEGFSNMPTWLPPTRDIQHCIDLIPRASLPNRPA